MPFKPDLHGLRSRREQLERRLAAPALKHWNPADAPTEHKHKFTQYDFLNDDTVCRCGVRRSAFEAAKAEQ